MVLEFCKNQNLFILSHSNFEELQTMYTMFTASPALLLYQLQCHKTIGELLFTFPVTSDEQRHFLHQESATAQTIHRLEAAYGDELAPALCDWRDEGEDVYGFLVLSNSINRLSDPTDFEQVWKTVAGR